MSGIPSIDRFRTSVYFADAGGGEWEVVDARRRGDGRLWEQYPGLPDAELRYFVRRGAYQGSQSRSVLEVRRYRFAGGETTWFIAEEWQRQLDAGADRTPVRLT